MINLSLADSLLMLVALRDQPDRADKPHFRFARHCLKHIGASHAQFLQDLWVDWALESKREGFFVEFGAGDGVGYSNSVFLERERGWSGILAEPARSRHAALQANRRCAIDRRCVWRASGERLMFNETPITAHSTIDAFSAGDDLAGTRVEGERYEVETVSLLDLLDQWNAPQRIDYLSLDTEGSELAILEAFDFARYDVRLITVEHNFSDKRDWILHLLRAHGYLRIFDKLSNVDDWYVKAR